MLNNSELIALRRELHKYPETGWCEFLTTSKVVGYLRSFGLKVLVGPNVINPKYVLGRKPEKVTEAQARALQEGANPKTIEEMGGYTGCAAILETGRPGPVIGIRFDIDCVDVDEIKENSHKPYFEGWASTHQGEMHACGHDGHTVMGIAVCSWLAENADKLCGTIKVLFQPAEEGVRGARPMTESGILDDVDFFFGNHLGLNLPTGIISPDPGIFLATTKLDAHFTGKASHAGAEPDKGKNALLASATAALSIHAIARPVAFSSSINVGTLRAGTGRNVVPPSADMQLEVRGETEEVCAYLREEAINRITGSAQMYGCTAGIEKVGEATDFKPDPEAINLVEKAATETVGPDNVKKLQLAMGSEDCTIMLKRVQAKGGKGTFIVFGSTLAAGHHQNRFDFDEDVIDIAFRFYQNLIMLVAGKRGSS